MASLKEVRNRISSVKSTQQITKAMKMVSAAKLRRAQTRITEMRPYAVKMNELLGNLSGSIEGSEVASYYDSGKGEKTLFVFMSSDRGLCGSFNAQLYKAIRSMAENTSNGIDIYCVGKKGRELAQRAGFNVTGTHDGFFNSFGWDESETIANSLLEAFENGSYERIYVCYNHFKNAATFIPTVEQWLPIQSNEADEENTTSNDYIFEPSKEGILGELVPKSLKTSFFKALLDNNAAEHGARMTAMSSATDNAQELLKNLSIEYNKARQAAITTEILEIVGGAEALENG